MQRVARFLVAALLVVGSSPAPARLAAADTGAGASAPVASVQLADSADSGGPLLPPDSSIVDPSPVAVQAPLASLSRLGTLRIPALGIRQSVYLWRCTSGAIVPNLVVRWGCATGRNQYLTGHAYGVFHSYYLAYARHHLTTGMVAYFVDVRGHVTRYRLQWVRLVRPNFVWRGLAGGQWAWENTAKPALTLQTCWGPTNAYRIVTRFVQG